MHLAGGSATYLHVQTSSFAEALCKGQHSPTIPLLCLHKSKDGGSCLSRGLLLLLKKGKDYRDSESSAGGIPGVLTGAKVCITGSLSKMFL